MQSADGGELMARRADSTSQSSRDIVLACAVVSAIAGVVAVTVGARGVLELVKLVVRRG